MCEHNCKQRYRPCFHFTPLKGWLNDPNGLIYLNGQYHLFYQLDPEHLIGKSDNKHWGHAVSSDLVKWKHLPIAIYADETGSIWSGSTVVDVHNCSGLQTGCNKTLIAFYTSRTQTQQRQSIAFSSDYGLTWQKYKGNPILTSQDSANPNFRDPRVFWHEKTKKWIMVVYQCRGNDKRGFAFYSSDNLLDWRMNSWIEGFFECPDIFDLPVDGDKRCRKWVLIDTQNYTIGDFDGVSFHKEGPILKIDQGVNFYATQTWDDTVRNRRIQIAWMRGGIYPNMPFNQQLSFPCVLSLTTFKEGIRLCRNPLNEIEKFYTHKYSLEYATVNSANQILKDIKSNFFDIYAEFNIINGNDFGLIVRGEKIVYLPASHTISFLGADAKLYPENNMVKIRLIVDKTSIELFGDGGKLSMSSCFLPDVDNQNIYAFSEKNNLGKFVPSGNCDDSEPLIKKMIVYKLNPV